MLALSVLAPSTVDMKSIITYVEKTKCKHFTYYSLPFDILVRVKDWFEILESYLMIRVSEITLKKFGSV